MSIFRTNLETTISNVSLRSTSLHMQLNKQYIRFIKYLHHCNIGGSFSIYRFGIPNPQTDLTSGCDQIIFWSHLDHIWPFGGLVNTYTASPSLRMPPRGARIVLLFLKKKKAGSASLIPLGGFMRLGGHMLPGTCAWRSGSGVTRSFGTRGPESFWNPCTSKLYNYYQY